MTAETSTPLTFRSNIRPWLGISLAIAVSGPVLYTVIYFTSPHMGDRPFSYVDLLLALLATSFCGAMIAAIAIASRRFNVVKVYPAGLQCYDRFGRNHFIAWQEILSVLPVQHDGLRYLYIRVPFTADSVTLPLFLEDMSKFVDAVEGYAGRENALVKELRGG